MKPPPVILSLLVLLPLCGNVAAQPSTFEERFFSASEGAPLDKLPGWSRHYGEGDTPLMLMAAGYEGFGARFAGKASFRREIEGVREGRRLELRFKLRVIAENDAYGMSQVMLGQSGGVNGVFVRFNGGNKDGWEDNFIEVSAGGASWGKVRFEALPDSRWHKGVWHEVVVSGIGIDGARDGEEIGKVSIRELDTENLAGKTLVKDAPLACVGAGAFELADVIVIGNAGSARPFDVDDISLKAEAP